MCANTLPDVHRDLSLDLRTAGKQYKAHANRHRLAAPTFIVDDMVWLLRRHIATTRPYAKLDYKKLGPFHILERVNPVTFRLTLPPHFVFTIFHVFLLELYHRIPGRQPPSSPPVELSTGEEYEVDQILNSRLC